MGKILSPHECCIFQFLLRCVWKRREVVLERSMFNMKPLLYPPPPRLHGSQSVTPPPDVTPRLLLPNSPRRCTAAAKYILCDQISGLKRLSPLPYWDCNAEKMKNFCPLQMRNFQGRSMGRRCGRWSPSLLGQPSNIVESPHNLTVRFHSDQNRAFSGFQARWTFVNDQSKFAERFWLWLNGWFCVVLWMPVLVSCGTPGPEDQGNKWSTKTRVSLFSRCSFSRVLSGVAGCSGNLHEITVTGPGEFTSPNFPALYPSFTDCYFLLSVGQNEVKIPLLTSPFLHFPWQRPQFLFARKTHISQQNRFLSSSVLSSFLCGWSKSDQQDIVIPVPSWDPLVHHVGQTEGSWVPFSESGVVSSSGFFQLIQLNLEQDTFEIEFQATCQYDFLEFFDGPTLQSDSLGRFCGSGRQTAHWSRFPGGFPASKTSTSNRVYVRFHTDGSMQKKGFKLSYDRVGRPSTVPGKSQCATISANTSHSY